MKGYGHVWTRKISKSARLDSYTPLWEAEIDKENLRFPAVFHFQNSESPPPREFPTVEEDGDFSVSIKKHPVTAYLEAEVVKEEKRMCKRSSEEHAPHIEEDRVRCVPENKKEGTEKVRPMLTFWTLKQEEEEMRGGNLADDTGMGTAIQAITLVLTKLEIHQSTRSSSVLPETKYTLVICTEVAIKQWKSGRERITPKSVSDEGENLRRESPTAEEDLEFSGVAIGVQYSGYTDNHLFFTIPHLQKEMEWAWEWLTELPICECILVVICPAMDFFALPTNSTPVWALKQPSSEPEDADEVADQLADGLEPPEAEITDGPEQNDVEAQKLQNLAHQPAGPSEERPEVAGEEDQETVQVTVNTYWSQTYIYQVSPNLTMESLMDKIREVKNVRKEWCYFIRPGFDDIIAEDEVVGLYAFDRKASFILKVRARPGSIMSQQVMHH
ncbi:uncharacterized protein LOC122078079 [Macadamia integrifolia]|uniref:uncharacterized protein LOC122078079 n=1 Tax=Macadamia integrifolia TaxID=60698 RepID=UPI001C4E726B|nr:uncharacterized protein LOC122078079 [Macadamia integrifolia]